MGAGASFAVLHPFLGVFAFLFSLRAGLMRSAEPIKYKVVIKDGRDQHAMIATGLAAVFGSMGLLMWYLIDIKWSFTESWGFCYTFQTVTTLASWAALGTLVFSWYNMRRQIKLAKLAEEEAEAEKLL